MRHRHKGRKLNRTWSHKKAMLRNMVTTFLDLEQIETTDAKAKELRSLAERLVTLGKRGSDDLAARRQALKIIRSKKVVAKLFNELGPRYADRPGGYTRIVKVDQRRGDGAQLSILQFVTEPVTFKDMKHKRARLEEEAVAAKAEKPVADADKPAEAGGVDEAAVEAEEQAESPSDEAEPVEEAPAEEPEKEESPAEEAPAEAEETAEEAPAEEPGSEEAPAEEAPAEAEEAKDEAPAEAEEPEEEDTEKKED
jgi:large subunit ribosomal protein L17